MTVKHIAKITGPPGCGKTTEIMRLVTAACQKYNPDKIGAVSFTNAAIEEIRSRIYKTAKFKTKDKTAKNVRTLHSHCFRLLGLHKDNIAERHWKDFCIDFPHLAFDLYKSGKEDETFEWDPHKYHNEKLFTHVQKMRNRCFPREKWGDMAIEMDDAWQLWMEANGLTDFTGMLEKTVAESLMPDIEILFVDEAQDLTPLQYKLTQMWSRYTVNTTYAGDSDQAIFRFAGALPEQFIELEAKWKKHLEQSYRVSPAVHEYARRVAGNIGNRENTTFKPCLDYGDGQVIVGVNPDFSLEGEHMIICRCNYQIKKWIELLIKNNITWHNPYRYQDKAWNPCDTQSWMAAKAYQALIKGGEVSARNFKEMIRLVKAKGNIEHGKKSEILAWEDMQLERKIDIFDLKAIGMTNQFIDGEKPITEILKLKGRSVPILKHMLSMEEDASKTPRVVIGTIHSVKGGESDHVWVDTELSPMILREMQKSERASYDEARVAYVAVTRARQTVGLLRSRMWNPMLRP